MSASPRAGSLPKIGGALALDFCNSSSGRGTAKFIEHLFDYEDLLRWAVGADLLTPAQATQLLSRAGSATAARAFARAMHVRAVLNAMFDALARRRPVAPATLLAFEREYKRAWRSGAARLTSTGLVWQFASPAGDPHGVTDAVLRSAEQILAERDLTRLRQCSGEGCGWVFLDDTKRGHRVWCEMQVCGTRAKLKARAARRKLARGSARTSHPRR